MLGSVEYTLRVSEERVKTGDKPSLENSRD